MVARFSIHGIQVGNAVTRLIFLCCLLFVGGCATTKDLSRESPAVSQHALVSHRSIPPEITLPRFPNVPYPALKERPYPRFVAIGARCGGVTPFPDLREVYAEVLEDDDYLAMDVIGAFTEWVPIEGPPKRYFVLRFR